jgi:geranylgeranyl pyrophosphate synthase
MLFQAGTECAALLAGCSPATTDSIKDWILCSAMAYQLKDDLEDFAADSEKGMGRGVGTDLKTKKPTFILATAMNRASAADRSIMQSWLYAHDSGIGPDTIMRILDETSALSVCSGKINELIAEADAALRGSAAISEEDRQELMSFSKYFISDSYWKRALPQPAA